MGAQPCLESDRLKLRPFSLSDSKDIQLLAGDFRVAKETMNIPHPYKDGVAEAWISSLEEKWKAGESVEYAITLKEHAQFIGVVSFVEVNGDEAEIGYWLGVPYWKKGYGTEAGRRLIEYGVSVMSLRKITALHLSTNPNSGRVLKKLGLDWKESLYLNDRDGNNAKFEFYQKTDL